MAIEYSTESANTAEGTAISEVALPGLEGYLKSRFQNAYDAKTQMHVELVKNLRLRKGEYSTTELNEIKKIGGSQAFMKITDTKCRALESWLRDLLMGDAVIPYDIVPTPIPDLSDDIREKIKERVAARVLEFSKQAASLPNDIQMEIFEKETEDEYKRGILKEAKERALKMKRIMDDQLIQGGFMDAFSDFIGDLTTYKAAFIKGHILRKKKMLKWVGKDPVIKEDIIPCWDRKSPFDIFPQPGVSSVNEGYLFDREKFVYQDLHDLIGLPGYNEEKIRAALNDYQNGTMPTWMYGPDNEYEKEWLENKKDGRTNYQFIYSLTYYGGVRGSLLKEWGMNDDQIDDDEKEYDSCCIMVGNYVIKAQLNFDPLGRKPMTKTSAFKIPGAFWHAGIPDILEDIQKMCNTSAREIQNNMAFSSGPILEVNIDKIPDGQDITQMTPRMIIQTITDINNLNTANAIKEIQIASHAGELLTIYRHFEDQADSITGIPKYVYGDSAVGGAGRTASGLSMLMASASKGIRQIVNYIDKEVIEPIIQNLYDFNMRYNDDFDAKGDVQIVARGASIISAKEQNQARKLEFLQMTANPIDASIVGQEGRAEILRDVAKSLEMDEENIVPSKEQLMLQGMSQSNLQQQGAEAQGNQPSQLQSLNPDGSKKGVSTIGNGA